MTEGELADWQYAHQEELDADEGELVDFEVAYNLKVVHRVQGRHVPLRADRT